MLRSALSRLRTIAKAFSFGAPKIVSTEKVEPEEQPRLMAEVLGRNTYGIVLLFVPERGLFYVHPDGTTNCFLDHSLAERVGNHVRFPMMHPLNANPRPYLTFTEVGATCTYYARPDDPRTLTELPLKKFEIEETGLGLDRKITVTLK